MCRDWTQADCAVPYYDAVDDYGERHSLDDSSYAHGGLPSETSLRRHRHIAVLTESDFAFAGSYQSLVILLGKGDGTFEAAGNPYFIGSVQGTVVTVTFSCNRELIDTGSQFIPPGTCQIPVTATDVNGNSQTATLSLVITP